MNYMFNPFQNLSGIPSYFFFSQMNGDRSNENNCHVRALLKHIDCIWFCDYFIWFQRLQTFSLYTKIFNFGTFKLFMTRSRRTYRIQSISVSTVRCPRLQIFSKGKIKSLTNNAYLASISIFSIA